MTFSGRAVPVQGAMDAAMENTKTFQKDLQNCIDICTANAAQKEKDALAFLQSAVANAAQSVFNMAIAADELNQLNGT